MKTNIIRYLFSGTMALLALTGFGQMPIFKRYYIADIPGLGWLARFYVTHYLHYLAAALLFALAAYMITDYGLHRRRDARRILAAGYVRGAVLAAISITGILLVARNFPGYRFSPGVIIFLDISHLGLVMLYLLSALFCLLFKKNWTAVSQLSINKDKP